MFAGGVRLAPPVFRMHLSPTAAHGPARGARRAAERAGPPAGRVDAVEGSVGLLLQPDAREQRVAGHARGLLLQRSRQARLRAPGHGRISRAARPPWASRPPRVSGWRGTKGALPAAGVGNFVGNLFLFFDGGAFGCSKKDALEAQGVYATASRVSAPRSAPLPAAARPC